MSFTFSPASRRVLAVPPVEMSSDALGGEDLGKGDQPGLVGDRKQSALNFHAHKIGKNGRRRNRKPQLER